MCFEFMFKNYKNSNFFNRSAFFKFYYFQTIKLDCLDYSS